MAQEQILQESLALIRLSCKAGSEEQVSVLILTETGNPAPQDMDEQPLPLLGGRVGRKDSIPMLVNALANFHDPILSILMVKSLPVALVKSILARSAATLLVYDAHSWPC